MGLFNQVFPESLYIIVKVDDILFPNITSAKMQHGVNAARSFSCSFAGKEALEHCRLGAKVEVHFGRGMPDSNIFKDDKTFIGIIKSLKPGSTSSSFTALDYTTHLAESQYVNYKAQDYIGEDLYFAAADACNYKGIDTSKLVRGSGIPITKDMDLFGWKTRKEFIDACFDEMKVLVNDDRHPTNTINQWQYAIRNGKVMDFFLPDPDNNLIYPAVTLSEQNKNIVDENVVSQIDTSRIVNAITIVSSADDKIYAQLEDFGSQDRYGVIGKFMTHPSSSKAELENAAYLLVNRFKEPTISYVVSLANQDNLDLGDLLEIDLPSIPKNVIKTIVNYEITFGDTISTRYQIGQTKISFEEYLEILKKPTNR
tara:strand:- start:529 stop:1635 length:1107 start_codon:yes stop_codon:yes gene_type:complete